MPKYQKIVPVTAVQMHVHFHVQTQEGLMRGEPGDYLCGPGAEGEFWPVKRTIFETTYRIMEEGNDAA